MIIIPALDIRNGKVTQLKQGKEGTEKYYGDPLQVAIGWEKKGAKVLHLIDLDAALGSGDNLPIIKLIRSTVSIPIQFGGGVRSIEKAREILNLDIDRVILGSAVVKDPSMVDTLISEYGKERIMVAVDSRGGRVAISGWKEKTNITTLDLIKKFEDKVFGFLVTDVDKEGLMKGIDIREFKQLTSSTRFRICASGGITTKEDLRALRDLNIWGCVVGKALYEGSVDFIPSI